MNKSSDDEAAPRLQKLLAQAGYGSRREIEQWIRAGRIRVDGRTAVLGDRVAPSAKITIDGKPAPVTQAQRQSRRVILYNKPEGEICSLRDPEGRPSVYANLPRLKTGRWISVGRLDFNTQGLLIFTTDGELAHRLMHPSSQIEREYAVRVRGEVSPEILQRITEGVSLDDGPARFDSLRDAGGTGSNHWYHVTLREGRRREVRRIWESQEVQVTRLVRVRFGPVTLPRFLKRGKWCELEDNRQAALCQAAGLAASDSPA